MPTYNGTNQDDYIIGSPYDDRIRAYNGDDEVHADSGDDRIEGGRDDDYIYGDDGNDTIFGGYGDDYLSGGYGNDRIYGGDGYDKILGGEGNDSLRGNQGPDEFYFNPHDGQDTISDFTQGEDTIVLAGFNQYGIYDYNDLDIEVVAGNSVIDLSSSLNEPEGTQTITVLGVPNLDEDDFEFAPGQIIFLVPEGGEVM